MREARRKQQRAAAEDGLRDAEALPQRRRYEKEARGVGAPVVAENDDIVAVTSEYFAVVRNPLDRQDLVQKAQVLARPVDLAAKEAEYTEPVVGNGHDNLSQGAEYSAVVDGHRVTAAT